MPEFGTTTQKGQLVYADPGAVLRWVRRQPDGTWVLMTLKTAAPLKSSPQLGYYYGLLLPEILQHYLGNGMAIRMYLPNVDQWVDMMPNKKLLHEQLKAICGMVGDEAAKLDIGDMDQHSMAKFIDHVLLYATNDLQMGGGRLEAKRPKETKCQATTR